MSHSFYDVLESRPASARAQALSELLPRHIAHAKAATAANADRLRTVDPETIRSVADLRALPILRKSDLAGQQSAGSATDPFGGFAACGWSGVPAKRRARRVFQSPGPIYEPEAASDDGARAARALYAAGFRPGDLVHNSFSYHLTPAGVLMEQGAFALGCTVFPAGVGHTELQLAAMLRLQPHGYTGTPGFLRILLEHAESQGKRLSVTKALFSGEAYPPSLRDWMLERGVRGFQCYASADLGLIAYETEAREGLVVDEGVIVEILHPHTGEPMPEGSIGEVVVTTLDADYPLLRFATGDLSAVLPGPCPTGRTNTRLRGWLGRADQATKVRGMFVHPSQVADVLRRHPELLRARLRVEGAVSAERMVFCAETRERSAELQSSLVASIRDVTKLRSEVLLVAPGELEDDGKVIDDRRDYN
jgi:phenylacetate-CoA ligase